jgi:glycyl-radical enzyme activating protein
MQMNATYDHGLKGTVFNIQRFSLHDGPGIRTVVFLKGCSLRCRWCSNPESLSKSVQIGVFANRCLGVDKCRACLDVAPDPDGIEIRDGRVQAIRARRGDRYVACAEACPTGALKVWGRRVTVAAVMKEVLADRAFYESSGGGLTLSGGEAMLQPEFAAELLKAARAEGIGTCMETALNVPGETLDGILPLLDMIFCDLKHLDPAAHRDYTGASNERILANLRKVVASGMRVVIRMPFVPEHNGTHANLHAAARFVAEEFGPRVHQFQLLPFRKLGEEKYAALGMRYPMRDLKAPPRDSWEQDLTNAAEIMSGYGVAAVAGAGHRVSA